MKSAIQLLEAMWQQGKHLCVGLDPDLSKIPKAAWRGSDEATLVNFCCSIIEATGSIAVAFKANRGFFGSCGDSGVRALQAVIGFAHEKFPEVLFIVDGKWNDIGNSAEQYAREAFGVFPADAATVNPYLGQDACEPFLKHGNKLIFWLCLTSNTGAGEFQKHGNPPLFLHIAERISQYWNGNNNCGLVVGATHPEELAAVRKVAPELPLLLPGIGKQQGDIDASTKAAIDRFLMNESRSILYASSESDFAEKSAEAAEKTHQRILMAKSSIKEG
ncbi:orotidine-5'-phosphate decarboxylase [Candidatus Falkowbacteria bacterium CG10_big_fil_rev_8_21_14_0_10_43_11]|uniref:Orotidine-5'-phosphate decarboxylase n=1 Tax=Candidatus Falkowbacteria bacterium CG10_big_fil_rev_8_21_14_0_10_43_11 TaxID=1974568 RepID=A0A2M6WLD8_9BACT|nr:MAG: orotidine-5'-phosphate decarboxylase [Candidatus Falkowbacteria bacterium CG10_big_fil_rev_8_21_14_0_10_43_11]